jgi:amidophosphoribosyltransferase
VGDWKPQDKCGVVGVTGVADASTRAYYGLRALQHRGQESAGISSVDDESEIHRHRGMGLVEQIFEPETLEGLPGTLSLGHVRYSTTGESKLEMSQPLVVSSSHGPVAVSHNGDITNAPSLRKELEASGWGFLTESDTEVAVRLLANNLADTHSPLRAIKETVGDLEGAFSFALTIGDRLFAVRDPHGIRPLVLGKFPEGGRIVASETAAFNVTGAERVWDVEPGSIVEVGEDKVSTHTPRQARNQAHCQFEYVYFAQADSILDDREVYEVRRRIGRRLARESPREADVVVPVPDSGRSHAQGFSDEADLPFREGLMKNRYAHRTFIMPDQESRELGVRVKLNPVHSVLEGRRVILVDDSIVRGTTMDQVVDLVREAGATEVHVRIGSPPIVSPCYLGVDINAEGNLIATDKDVDGIRKKIGADSLAYLSREGLVESIGMDESDLCMGCLTGQYPVDIEGEEHRAQETLF